MSETPHSPSKALYDAECGFCRWSIDVVRSWDRYNRIEAVTIQSPEGQSLLKHLPEGERLASWHLVLADGQVRSAGRAIAPLLRLLPGGSPLARLADLMPAFTDRLYRFIASRRSFFGRVLHRLGQIPARRL